MCSARSTISHGGSELEFRAFGEQSAAEPARPPVYAGFSSAPQLEQTWDIMIGHSRRSGDAVVLAETLYGYLTNERNLRVWLVRIDSRACALIPLTPAMTRSNTTENHTIPS